MAREKRSIGRMNRRLKYEERINRVVEYISDHLDETIDLNTLAEIACMSPYHWHRVYVGMRGETVAATVKRLRLQRASGLLISSDLPVSHIARDCGYSNIQSFTRIFKSVYGLPPATYRQNGPHEIFNEPNVVRDQIMFDVQIQECENKQAFCVSHQGPYIEIHKAFDRLCGWMGARQLLGAGSEMFGLYYDDPDSIDADKLRSKAGVFSESDLEAENPVERVDVQGGRYAVIEYVGPYESLYKAYRWLYGDWLAGSDEELANKPSIEVYLNDPQVTPPTELRTQIYMPLT